MSGNLTRYCDILAALTKLCRTAPTGNHARHLTTLALFISGIVGSHKCQLGAVASKAAPGSLRESRIKRLTRWVQNERITPEVYFLPSLDALLASLLAGPLVLVMDGSTVGRGCMALVVSVLYQKRALPVGWQVVVGEKGNLSDEPHQQLLEQIAKRLPPGSKVIFRGDGEFDGAKSRLGAGNDSASSRRRTVEWSQSRRMDNRKNGTPRFPSTRWGLSASAGIYAADTASASL